MKGFGPRLGSSVLSEFENDHPGLGGIYYSDQAVNGWADIAGFTAAPSFSVGG